MTMPDGLSNADTMAICAHLGVETKVMTDTFGRTLLLVNEEGMRKLADHAPIGAAAGHALVDQLLAFAADLRNNPPTEGTQP